MVADWPSGFITVTAAVPMPGGVVACRLVELKKVTPVADADPNLTVDAGTKPEPEIVTTVPPAPGPKAGLIPVIESDEGV